MPLQGNFKPFTGRLANRPIRSKAYISGLSHFAQIVGPRFGLIGIASQRTSQLRVFVFP
jgi:hypothetical protein